MSISSIPSNTASAITPFNPLGKLTVGEEQKDSKNSSFKAVEESSQSERTALRDDGSDKQQKVAAIGEEGKGKEKDDSQQQNEQQQKQQKEEKHREVQEREEIRELAARDREVRNHERAHAAVGGQYTGAPSYQFKRGPDGVNYAVAGEVSIETGSVKGNPEATISKAQQIRRAALAPADPSPQDRRVAAQASQMELQAREELSDKRRQEIEAKAEQDQQEQEEKTITADDNRAVRSEQRVSVSAVEQDVNQRVIEINRNYFNLENQNDRLGSIVSQSV